MRVDAALADALLMDGQHDGRGFFRCLVENVAQDADDEVHARIIVVVEQDHVTVRFLDLFFDDGGSVRSRLIPGFIGHEGYPPR